MDALQMDYPDDTFDLVWACESGEHMPDKKKYVEEMVRVLKPGGTLVIACWCQREEGDKCASTLCRVSRSIRAALWPGCTCCAALRRAELLL